MKTEEQDVNAVVDAGSAAASKDDQKRRDGRWAMRVIAWPQSLGSYSACLKREEGL